MLKMKAVLILIFGTYPFLGLFCFNLESVSAEVLFKHVIVDEDGPADIHTKSVGDLNGDGFIDLIVAGTKGTIVWYEYPKWQKHIIATEGGGWSTDAETDDIDGDGDQDLVTSDWYQNNKLVWFENPGTGENSWKLHIIGTPRAHDIETSDLDGDGDIDVVTRQQGTAGNKIEFWIQENCDSWTHRTQACPKGEGLHLGDIDNDNDPDVLIGDRWFENPSKSISNDWDEHIFTTSFEHPDTFPYMGDINQDGNPDIVLVPTEPRGKYYRISWFEAPEDPKNTGWIEHIIDSPIECVHHSLGICDINGDDTLDVVTAEMHQGSDPDEVKVYLNYDDGLKWIKRTIARTGSHSLRVTDIGNDGDYDIFGANWSKTKQVNLWENFTKTTSKLGLDKWNYIQVDDSRTSRAFGLAMNDLTHDCYEDIVAGSYFYRNPGGDMMGKWVRIHFPQNPDAVLIVDVDGDSFGDVISMNLPNVYWLEAMDSQGNDWNTIKIGEIPKTPHGNGQGYSLAQVVYGGKPEILLAGGDGIYYFEIPGNPEKEKWPRTKITGPASEEGIGFGDIDRDDDIDICGGIQKGTGRTGWWENPGNGTGNWGLHEVGTIPDKYADRFYMADLNNDKRLDIVLSAANGGKNGVYWWEQPVQIEKDKWTLHTITVQNTTNSLDIADMDMDGDIDIIAAEHRGTKKVQIWENTDNASSWIEHIVSTGKESHLGARVSDLDCDGDLDIISIAWDDFRFLHIWRNDAR